MCGRYVLRNITDIAVQFHIDEYLAELLPRYNAAPGQMMPVLYQYQGRTMLEMMQWGLIPAWSHEPRARYVTINARCEDIATKPAFRLPIRQQRCIIPSDGFYEWRQQGKYKQPFFIHMRDDSLYGMGGIYDIFRQPDGSMLKTFSIITTAANDLINPIHNRMDVIIPPDVTANWLNPANTDIDALQRFFMPYASSVMEMYPVSTRVNSSRYDDPSLVQQDDDNSQQTDAEQGTLF